MSEDTLNEKLYEAISNITATAYGDIEGRTEAVNECEKICLSQMIDLLNKIDNGTGVSLQTRIWNELQSLTHKLNSLK